MDILERLEPLSEQNGLLRFLRNEDHAGLLNGFVQDIAQTVTDYQVCRSETHSSTLLTHVQTSLQQSTYENTKDILEVARDAHKISRNTADKAKEIIVSVVGVDTNRQALTFLTGSCGSRNIGQARPHTQRRIPG